MVTSRMKVSILFSLCLRIHRSVEGLISSAIQEKPMKRRKVMLSKDTIEDEDIEPLVEEQSGV